MGARARALVARSSVKIVAYTTDLISPPSFPAHQERRKRPIATANLADLENSKEVLEITLSEREKEINV